MKNVLKYFLCLLLSFFLFITVNALEIQSSNAILYNINDNEILFEKNKDEKVQIASLTKLMTALVVINSVDDLDKKITLKNEDFKGLLEENLVTAGFTIGQTVTYRDLLYGLIIKSGGECAKGLSNNISSDFVSLMNEKAKKLDLKSTHFSNSIGLDDENNYSTAYEVSLLFKEVLKNRVLKEIITADSYTSSDGRLSIKNKIRKNSVVGDYLLGGKTGTTDGAGLCLATIASKNDVDFLLVTLGAPYDKKGLHNYEDAKTIYENFINNYSYQDVVKKNDKILTLKTKYTKNDKVNFYLSKTIKKYLPNNYDKKDIKSKYKGTKIITSKIKKGTELGTLTFYYKDKKIASEKIILKEKQKFSYIKYIKDHMIETIFIVSALFLFIVFLFKKKNSKKKNEKSKI